MVAPLLNLHMANTFTSQIPELILAKSIFYRCCPGPCWAVLLGPHSLCTYMSGLSPYALIMVESLLPPPPPPPVLFLLLLALVLFLLFHPFPGILNVQPLSPCPALATGNFTEQ